MNPPLVYAAIAAVAAKLSKRGIAKSRESVDGSYRYRSIDDIYAGLAPLLAKHQLCVLPRVIERHCQERTTPLGDALFQVAIRVAFDFVAVDDGSTHTVETYGEAIDDSDKATAKAMSAAYKYAAMQTFCILQEKRTLREAHDAYARPRLRATLRSRAGTSGLLTSAKWCEAVKLVTRSPASSKHIARSFGSLRWQTKRNSL